MIKLKEAIVVEGKYDKIRLENIFDTVIIVTNGFNIYKNKAKQNYIKEISKQTKIIVLTDSDSSGLQIRKFIHTLTNNVTDVYLPQIAGKEKRKQTPSSQGFLGVEGIDDKIIIDTFSKFTIEENTQDFASVSLLYEDGLVGKSDSKQNRQNLLKQMNLPINLSTSDLIKVLNKLYTKSEYKKLLEKSKKIV